MDLILKNCTIIDGSSVNIYNGDIGIIDNYIVRVGNLQSENSKKIIDCHQNIVCPGFIDPGIISPNNILEKDFISETLKQGITTAILENPGTSLFSHVPIKEMVNEELIEKKIKSRIKEISENLPHNNLFLIEYKSIRDRIADINSKILTSYEYDRIENYIKLLLDLGAFGISIDLSWTTFSQINFEEISTISKLLNTSHYLCIKLPIIRENNINFIDELIKISKENSLHIHITNLKIPDNRTLSKITQIIDMNVMNNINITCDISPLSFSIENSLDILPHSLKKDSPRKILKKIKDPLIRLKIKSKMKRYLTEDDLEKLIFIFNNERNEDLSGKSIKEAWLFQNNKLDIFDFILTLLSENKLNIDILKIYDPVNYYKLLNDHSWLFPSTTDCPYILNSKTTLPSIYNKEASQITSILLYKFYEQDGLSGLKKIVEKFSNNIATSINIHDRGRIAPGYYSDLLILNRDNLVYNPINNSKQFSTSIIDKIVINGAFITNFSDKNGMLIKNL